MKEELRLQNFIAALCIPVFAQTGSLDDTRWRAYGTLTIDTANTNCYETAVIKVLDSSTADTTMLQETELRSLEDIAAARRKARAHCLPHAEPTRG